LKRGDVCGKTALRKAKKAQQLTVVPGPKIFYAKAAYALDA